MTTTVTMFKSTTANLFDTEHAALCDDLRGLLVDTGAVNDASATAAVKSLVGDIDKVRDLLKRIADTRPGQDKPARPFESLLPNTATSEFSKIGTNSGHGHVWARPDGVKMRCGGPGVCYVCANEKMLFNRFEKAGK